MSEYEQFFREKGVSWGIYIKINCSAIMLSEYRGNPIKVSENLYFHRETFPKEDPVYVAKRNNSFSEGLKLVANEFSVKVNNPTVIKVIDLDWLPTDFQIEAYGYAIAGWVIQEFKLNINLPTLKYDNEAGRYIFPYHIIE